MKTVLSIIVSTVVGSLVFASGAQAATCTISGATGANSNNQCTVNTQNTWTVTNTNDIKLSNNNPQTATSGDASVTGNTTGGGATSGNASNTSAMLVNLNITNGGRGAGVTPTKPGGQVSGVSTTAAAAAAGRGAAASQVQAPVGGVGAGAGGLALPVLGLSAISTALGAYRLRKLTYDNEA